MENNKKANGHYAWRIFWACCLLNCGVIGLIQNCKGLFYAPVSEALGFSMGSFTFHSTVYGFCAALALPLAGVLIHRGRLNVQLGIAGIAFGGSIFAMSFFDSLWQWYIAGAVQGLSGGFLIYLPVPMLISNWFQKNKGLMLGIAGSVTGIVGAVMSVVFSFIIETVGWRGGYFIMGGLSVLLVAPAMFLLIKESPEQMGLSPYGAGEDNGIKSSETPIKARESFICKNVFAVMLLLVIASSCDGFLCGYASFLPSFAKSLGFPVAFGATLVSLSMICNMLGKLVYGRLDDSLGSKWAAVIGAAFMIFGQSMLLTRAAPLVMTGAFFSGVSMFFCLVSMPLIAQALLTRENYDKYYSISAMGSALAQAVSQVGVGSLYDIFGEYTQVMAIGVGMAAMVLICIVLQFFVLKKIDMAEVKKI